VTYQVVIQTPARRQLLRLSKIIQDRIEVRLDALATNPRPHGMKALVGRPDTYRIRVGDYRVIYRIEDDQLIVLVVEIGHRKDIYG